MKKNIHVLHFKLDKEKYAELSIYAKNHNKSISKTIVSIIEEFMPFIEKNHISFQDKESRYRFINNKKKKNGKVSLCICLKYIIERLNIFIMT